MPRHVFTSEEARAAQLKGVPNREKARAEKLKLRKTLEVLLELPVRRKGGKVHAEQIENLAKVNGLNIDAKTAIAVAMIRNAMDGDTTSAVFVRDTIGEKPTDKMEVEGGVTIEDYAKSHKLKL